MSHVGARLVAVMVMLCGAGAANAAEALINGFGYAQFTAEPIANDEKQGVRYGADRVRLGASYEAGAWFGRVEMDLNNGDIAARNPGTLNNLLHEISVGRHLGRYGLLGYFEHDISVKTGQFKIPVGMDFMTPGNQLDIVKRGIDRGLVLDRSLGIMVLGSKLLDRFGYEFGVFNMAGRSAATRHTVEQEGDINAVAGRVYMDHDDWLHVEASLGYSALADGSPERTAEAGFNYFAGDFGATAVHKRWIAKYAYTFGINIRGIEDWNQQVVMAHLGYRWSPRTELVTRIYQAGNTFDGRNVTLTNLFMGGNFYFDPSRTHNRLQINYVLSGGDAQWEAQGVGGFLSDALFIQFQIGFEHDTLFR